MNKFNILNGFISNIGDMTTQYEKIKTALNNLDEIQRYAEFGCDESITEQDAKKISEAGLTWLDEVNNGNGEWSRMRYDAKRLLNTEE